MLIPAESILDLILEDRTNMPINAIHMHSRLKADLYPVRKGMNFEITNPFFYYAIKIFLYKVRKWSLWIFFVTKILILTLLSHCAILMSIKGRNERSKIGNPFFILLVDDLII